MQEVKILVMPVKRVSVQGRGNYVISLPDGTKVSAGRTFHRDVQKTFTFACNKEGTKLLTGLEKLIENPYYEQDFNELPDDIRPKGEWLANYDERLKSKDKITLQTFYEVLDNVPEGTYTSDKSKVSMVNGFGSAALFKNWEPTYLENFRIYLGDTTNVFTNKTSRGRLAIQMIKNHPKIAKNSKEVNINVHEFYIATEEESYAEKSASRRLVSKAVARLESLIEKTETNPNLLVWTCGALGILKGQNMTRIKMLDFLESWIWEEKKINNLSRTERINIFNEIYPLTESPEGVDRLYVKYLINMAISNNVFAMSNGAVMWLSKKGTNLFELGRDMKKIETGFVNDLEKKRAELESPLGDLESELASKNILVDK